VDEKGTVLWSRNARDRYPNASTTKMTTALLVAARTGPREIVTVSSTAAALGGGGHDLTAGDTYTVRDLLYALLLDSSNEAAVALAEHVAGTEARFVTEMNGYVRSLGARRTHYANAHGLDADGHYSSAGDLALIGRALLDNPRLAEIVSTPRTTIGTPTGAVAIENRNLLLESYPGAIGIKTGRTLGAGNVLVAAARRGKHTLVAVAMNSFDTFSDTARLLDYGFAEVRLLSRQGILMLEGTTVGALVFDGEGSTRIVAATEVEGILPPEGEEVKVVMTPAPNVSLPIAPGQPVGTIEVSTSRGPAGTVEAIALDPLGSSEGSWIETALTDVMGVFGAAVEVFA
jgi:D-alanyl-D-alanine carboxypeptidase (penicillin-binding protein 5/6)